MGEPIDKLIQDSAAEGEFDSRGQFEIQGDRALAKLSQFTVSGSEQWILKMVQAAVAGGANSLRITQGRWEVSLRFGLRDLPSTEDVEGAILYPERVVGPFLQELAIGLRSLLESRRFRVGWPSQCGHLGLEWNGAKFLSGTVKATPAFEVTVAYPPNWVTGSYLVRAAESRILQTHAAYCPIPLFLDNREITVHDTPAVSKHSMVSSGYPRHVACGYLGKPQSEPITVEASRLRNPLHSRQPFMRWGRSAGLTTGSFSIFCSRLIAVGYVQESFRLIWTRHGVACAAHEIPDSPLGGFLQVSGDHLRTDLTGLALRVEDDDVARARRGIAGLEPIADQARHWVHCFQAKTTYAEMLKYTAAVTIGVVVVVAACASGFGEALGGLGYVGGGGSTKVDDFPSVFSQRVEKLLALGGPMAPLRASSGSNLCSP